MPEVQGVNINLNTIIAQFAGLIDSFTGIPATIEDMNANIISMASDLHAELEGVRTDIAGLQSALGIAAGGPTTTVTGLLTILQNQTRCLPKACPPGGDDPGGCVEPFVSTGQVASTDYGGRTFAVWNVDVLPGGVTEGSFLTHDVAHAQLVHDEAGAWSLYVQSTGSPTFSISPDLDTLYPTNQWIDISSNLDLAINVPTGTDVVAYLCTPSDMPFTECIDIDSVPGTYRDVQGSSTFTLALQAIDFGAIPQFTSAPSMTSNGSPPETESIDEFDGILTSHTEGLSIELLSGSTPVIIVHENGSGARDSVNLNFIGDIAVMAAGTATLLICNAAVGSPSDHPFSVRFCPPE